MKYTLKNKALLLCCCIALAGIPNVSYASTNYANPNYYNLGMQALNKHDYNNAIGYFKHVLKKDPSYTSARNNLAVAYTSRGNYYYNQANNLEKAATDFRSAIYYLQYYDKENNSSTINENIAVAQANLGNVLALLKTPTDPLSRLKKAKELRGQNELAAAVVEYAQAAKNEKYAYECNVAIGDIMKILSNEYNAAVYYDKALSLNSKDPYLHLKFGRTLYNLGNIETAVSELNIATENEKTKTEAFALLENIWKNRIAKSPKDALAQMNLGTVYQNQRKYNLAMAQYKTALSLEPRNQMVKLNLATLYQATGAYQEALNIYDGILKYNPDNFMANNYKAATLRELGKKDKAVEIYQKLLQENPTNKQVKQDLLNTISELPDITALNYLLQLTKKVSNDADIHYAYAYTLHKNKRYGLALTEYRQALAIDPQILDAYLNIASIEKQQNNNVNIALETLKTAQAMFPSNEKIKKIIAEYNEDNAYTLSTKASELYNQKLYDQAISVYNSIPNPSEDVFLGIGACYQAMGDYDTAITNYSKALTIDASNPNSHYFLGLAYLYKKDFVNAEKYLLKAKELDKVNPDIQDAYKTLQFAKSEAAMNEGIKLFESSKNNEAIEQFNKALELCPENGYAHYYRGLAYDALAKNQNAVNDYILAVQYNPELTMAYYSMAVSYENLNNKVEAKKMYQKFVQEYKTKDEYFNYAKQRITEL